jgi:hypothetical protein
VNPTALHWQQYKQQYGKTKAGQQPAELGGRSASTHHQQHQQGLVPTFVHTPAFKKT